MRVPVLGWILGSLYGIPIERPQDVKGIRINNAESFARVDEFLTEGGCLYIAPEGGSKVERRLRKVKTGTARISLSAESKNNFELGLKIIPVGLHYDNPLKFRSKVLFNVGKPIVVADFKEEWENNNRTAVKKLTAHIEESMRGLLLHTDEVDEDIDAMVRQAEFLTDPYDEKELDEKFKDSKKTTTKLQELKTANLSVFDTLKKSLQNYFDQLKEWNITDAAIAGPLRTSDYLTLILGFPLFIYGFINNLLPSIIPFILGRKLPLYKGYKPTIHVLSGLVITTFVYYLQSKWVFAFTESISIKWIYLISLLPAGIFAWWYMKKISSFQNRNRFVSLQKTHANEIKELLEQRNHLLNDTMKLS